MLAATDGTAAVRVGSTSKGKEKVTYPNNDGSQLLNLQIGSASGDAAYGRADIKPNGQEAEECEILGESNVS